MCASGPFFQNRCRTPIPPFRGDMQKPPVADDFIIGCEYEGDARRIMAVLPKRMEKYGLAMHPEKTRLLDLRKPGSVERKGKATFDFLGFRHYWGKSRRGYWVIQRKTAPKRLRRTICAVGDWCRTHRHHRVKEQHQRLCSKLRGHYNYYGVTGNMRSLKFVHRWAETQWHKWLNRRGGKYKNWDVFKDTILSNFPLPPPRIVHSAVM